MTVANDTDILSLLQKWTKTKLEIADLEKKIEKFKRLSNRIMDQEGTSTISSGNYILRRKEMSRYTISKKDVPVEIWKKYSRPCKYKAYYLSEKKNK
jgi:hypothetical protein